MNLALNPRTGSHGFGAESSYRSARFALAPLDLKQSRNHHPHSYEYEAPKFFTNHFFPQNFLLRIFCLSFSSYPSVPSTICSRDFYHFNKNNKSVSLDTQLPPCHTTRHVRRQTSRVTKHTRPLLVRKSNNTPSGGVWGVTLGTMICVPWFWICFKYVFRFRVIDLNTFLHISTHKFLIS